MYVTNKDTLFSLPVQSQCVQEGWQALHNEENSNCENSKEEKDYGQADKAPNAAVRKTNMHHHGPQDFWQLCAWDKKST